VDSDTRISSHVGEFGLLAVFLCPMVFGGITMYYSHKAIHKATLDRWGINEVQDNLQERD
jgi:hypothetical protein